MNVFLFPMVLSSCADTPKSTGNRHTHQYTHTHTHTHTHTLLPSLMSALSVSSTFCPLMSLWMTLCLCRWLSPCGDHMSREGGHMTTTHPQHLSGDVCDPVLLQAPVFGGLDEVRHRAGPAVLHHQLHTLIPSHTHSHALIRHCLPRADLRVPGLLCGRTLRSTWQCSGGRRTAVGGGEVVRSVLYIEGPVVKWNQLLRVSI